MKNIEILKKDKNVGFFKQVLENKTSRLGSGRRRENLETCASSWKTRSNNQAQWL
jgi:hypothetical protein